jgi:hypothetical protein
VPSDLDKLMTRMTRRLMRRFDVTQAVAEATVRQFVAREHANYVAAGMPFGDDATGLAQWITERPPRPPTA